MKPVKNTQEKTQENFLKNCEKFIKKYPSKNITGMCCDCFLWHIQRNKDFNFKSFVGDGFGVTSCYSIASFLQEKKIIKIKSGLVYGTSIDCFRFSFSVLKERNKI